jgi:hypothetical protein
MLCPLSTVVQPKFRSVITECACVDLVKLLDDAVHFAMIYVLWRVDDNDTSSLCAAMWKSCLALLSSLLLAAGQDAYVALSPVAVKYWRVLSGRHTAITDCEIFVALKSLVDL